MAKSELQDALIHTQDGTLFGTVVDASAATKVEVQRPDESRVWIERHHLAPGHDGWILDEHYAVYSAEELSLTESQVDESVEETFPASDPPSFMPGSDESKR